jgi:uncharacterized membrane protein YkvI
LDIYDHVFLFGAVLALCGAIMANAALNIPGNFGLPLWLAGVIIMLVGLIFKASMKRSKNH